MRELYQKYKSEIWVGLIVWIMTTVISNFGNWMIMNAPLIGNSIFEILSNIMYSLAADYTDNSLFRILLFGGLGIYIASVVEPVKKGIKTYKSALKFEKIIQKIPPDSVDKINEQVILELESQEKAGKQLDVLEFMQEGKKYGKLSVLMIILIVLSYTYLFFFIMEPMRLHNKFNHDIVKIAPYVEENMITQLKSDWVCMRSKSDYNEIYIIIDDIKDTYSLPN